MREATTGQHSGKRGLLALLLPVILTAVTLTYASPQAAASPKAVAAQEVRALKSTWSPNDTVYAVALRGSRVYLGGSFTKLRNPRTGQSVRARGLAVLNRKTGAPVWTARVSGVVRSLAVSADGSILFAGGAFTRVNGVHARNVAALSTRRHEPLRGWRGSASGTVRDLKVSGRQLYLAGQFTKVNGSPRFGLARLGTNNGSLRAWRANARGGAPFGIALTTDGSRLVVGGRFNNLSGAPRTYLGSVSTASGRITPWRPQPQCPKCTVADVAVDSGSAYVGLTGRGGHLTAYGLGNGRIRWSVMADGDVHSVAVGGGFVEAGGHFDPRFGGQRRHQLAEVRASNGQLTSFAPALRRPYPGVWGIVARKHTVYVGGGFTGIGRQPQAHFAIFTR